MNHKFSFNLNDFLETRIPDEDWLVNGDINYTSTYFSDKKHQYSIMLQKYNVIVKDKHVNGLNVSVEKYVDNVKSTFTEADKINVGCKIAGVINHFLHSTLKDYKITMMSFSTDEPDFRNVIYNGIRMFRGFGYNITKNATQTNLEIFSHINMTMKEIEDTTKIISLK